MATLLAYKIGLRFLIEFRSHFMKPIPTYGHRFGSGGVPLFPRCFFSFYGSLAGIEKMAMAFQAFSHFSYPGARGHWLYVLLEKKNQNFRLAAFFSECSQTLVVLALSESIKRFGGYIPLKTLSKLQRMTCQYRCIAAADPDLPVRQVTLRWLHIV